MADVAAGMVRPFGQKDRLDAALEKIVVEFWRRLRRGDGAGNGQRGHNRQPYESIDPDIQLSIRAAGDLAWIVLQTRTSTSWILFRMEYSYLTIHYLVRLDEVTT